MGRKLAENVTLLDDAGLAQQFTAGTAEADLPEWVAGRVTNPAVWGEVADDDAAKPRGRRPKPVDAPTD